MMMKAARVLMRRDKEKFAQMIDETQMTANDVLREVRRILYRAFYRCVQEGLTNAYRHGGAARVRITMWMGNDEVVRQIWDNGRGAQVISERTGLAPIRDSVQEIGGIITAANTPDGFEVAARIPWRVRGVA